MVYMPNNNSGPLPISAEARNASTDHKYQLHLHEELESENDARRTRRSWFARLLRRR